MVETGLLHADTLILRAIADLCTESVPQDRLPYFHENVHPLVHRLVEMLMESMPARPEIAVFNWLLGVVAAPPELVQHVQCWINGVEYTGNDACFEKHRRASDESIIGDDSSEQNMAMLSNRGRSVRHVEFSPDCAEDSGVVEFEKDNLKKSRKRSSAYRFCPLITPAGTVIDAMRQETQEGEVDLEKAYQMVQKVPMLQTLDPPDLEMLVRSCELLEHLEGDEILVAGEDHQGMHLVLEGEASVLAYSEIGTVGVGELLGSHSMLHGTPSNETIEVTKGSMKSLYWTPLTFKALGLEKKIKKMERKKKMRRLDQTDWTAAQPGGNVRASCILAEKVSSQEDLDMISESISRNRNLMEVASLTVQQIRYVAQDAHKQHFEAGTVVFKKGDQGTRFYVIDSGFFQVTDGDGDISELTLRPGDSFGEMASVCHVPRTATVTCTRSGCLWVVTHWSFINAKSMQKETQLAKNIELLGSVDIFQQMVGTDSLRYISRALEEQSFIMGEIIVQQGLPAETFYVISEGDCQVLVDGVPVNTIERGHHFGDLSSVKDSDVGKIHSASVKVVSQNCSVLVLDRASFSVVMNQIDLQAVENAKAGTTSSRFSLMDIGAAIQKPNDPNASSKRIAFSALQHIGILGKGAFGSVSLERDVDSNRLYALKAMCKKRVEEEGTKGMVQNEKQCLELLNSEFVVQLLGNYRDKNNIYLLLEACFGGELFDVYEQHGDFFASEDHAKFYAACTACALDHIHSRHIVYRDLKLENCLLTLSGYLKVTDMGIAKVCIGKTYTVCGTADYFAPETLRHLGHNRAVDWWALGVMIFIVMTGSSPFEAAEPMQMYRKIIKGFAKVNFPPEIPQHCLSMILGLCQKKPEERLTMGPRGVRNYKEHPWYRGMSWADLEEQRFPAPYLPASTEEQVIAKVSQNPEPLELGDMSDELYDPDAWDNIFAH